MSSQQEQVRGRQQYPACRLQDTPQHQMPDRVSLQVGTARLVEQHTPAAQAVARQLAPTQGLGHTAPAQGLAAAQAQVRLGAPTTALPHQAVISCLVMTLSQSRLQVLQPVPLTLCILLSGAGGWRHDCGPVCSTDLGRVSTFSEQLVYRPLVIEEPVHGRVHQVASVCSKE